jgi:hypothetical protein
MQDEVGGQGSSLLSSSVSPASAGVHAQIVYEKPLCYARTACKRGLGHKSHLEAQSEWQMRCRKRMHSEASISPLYHGLAHSHSWLVELGDQGARLCAVVD